MVEISTESRAVPEPCALCWEECGTGCPCPHHRHTTVAAPLVLICAWCVAEGTAALPPHTNPRHVTHGICDRHLAATLAELGALVH